MCCALPWKKQKLNTHSVVYQRYATDGVRHFPGTEGDQPIGEGCMRLEVALLYYLEYMFNKQVFFKTGNSAARDSSSYYMNLCDVAVYG